MNTAGASVRTGNYGASVEVEAFSRARLSELSALRDAVANGRANRRVHQQLAWHLRRRTLSHSSRRAPASIRAAHARELLQSQGPSSAARAALPGPRGSRRLRKYRARARFLRAHRALRNARPSRLETHEWHAKRFRMAPVQGTSADGLRVAAQACNDRGIRSAFRAFAHSSIAHDESYLDVISVQAAEQTAVAAALRAALLPQDADRALSDPVVLGTAFARGLLSCDPDSGRPIAPVDILFRPRADSCTIWVWAHPAASAAVAAAMRKAPQPVDVDVLRGQILTFALRGPRTGFVLGAALARSDGAGPDWDIVCHARSAACVPAGAVVAGEAVDPRSNFPPKRVQRNANEGVDRVDELAHCSRSAFSQPPADSRIWNATGRGALALDKNVGEVTMPFLLLQRPSGLDRGLGSGWDVVVPQGWGRPLWRSLMFANGSRAAGTMEWRHFEFETGQCVFPDDFPDSLEAKQALRENEKALTERYNLRPSSKRVNYSLYRVPSPFFPDLNIVGKSGSNSAESLERKEGSETDGKGNTLATRPKKRRRFARDLEPRLLKSYNVVDEQSDVGFRVLRERRKLRALLRKGRGKQRFVQQQYVKVSSVEHEMRTLALKSELEQGDTFVRAAVKPMGRGVVSKNALICAPAEEDLRLLGRGKLTEVVEKPRKKGDTLASRKCIGRAVHGNFSMARGCSLGTGFIKLDDVETLLADPRAVPRERAGHGDEEGVQVRVLVRNIDSLQYRMAVATVTW